MQWTLVKFLHLKHFPLHSNKSEILTDHRRPPLDSCAGRTGRHWPGLSWVQFKTQSDGSSTKYILEQLPAQTQVWFGHRSNTINYYFAHNYYLLIISRGFHGFLYSPSSSGHPRNSTTAPGIVHTLKKK